MHLTHIKDHNCHWTVNVNNHDYMFDPSHPEYMSLVECVKTGDASEFINLIEIGTAITNWSEGNFRFEDGLLWYGDEQVADQPTERIINMIKEGWDHKPMLAYLDNLFQNVSNRAVYESYTWCQHKGLPITPDGYLIGYKGVIVYNGEDTKDKNGRTLTKGDLVDKHTGNSFRNNVGDKPSMNRRQVSDNCNEGCAAGLHVGTFEYANDWAGPSGKVVLVKFNPADIVSVPTDCDFQKMRVSNYEVVSVVREIIEQQVYDGDDDEDDDMYDTDIYDDDGNLINDYDPYGEVDF